MKFILPIDRITENAAETARAFRDYKSAFEEGKTCAALNALDRAYEFLWFNYEIYRDAERNSIPEKASDNAGSERYLEIDEPRFRECKRRVGEFLEALARLSFSMRENFRLTGGESG